MSRAKKIAAQPNAPTFRVIKLAEVAKERMRAARGTTTNKDFIENAVSSQLDSLLEELAVVGIEPLADARAVRLPFSDGTLALLKSAGERVNIPAVALLRICLRRHSDSILAATPKRRGRKPSKKGGR